MNLEFKIVDNERTWNEFLIKTNPQAFFQDFFWHRIYQKSNTASWPVGIYQNQKLCGLSLVNLVRAKRGIFLQLRHGPVADTKTLANQVFWVELVDYMKAEFKKYGAWWIRVSPKIEVEDGICKLFRQLGFRPSPIHSLDAELSWILDISPIEAELLQNMRKTTRYLIKKAVNLGVEVDETSDLGLFRKLYAATAKRHGFVPHQDIEAEWEVFYKQRRAFMLLGSYQGQVLAVGIFVKFGNQVIYRHGASRKSEIPVSYLIQWEAIKKAKQLGCSMYNFWGIAPSDNQRHPWQGITLFKKGFGGEPQEFIHTQDLALSPLYALSYMIEMVRKFRKGY